MTSRDLVIGIFRDVASKILCLHIYHELEKEEQKKITSIITKGIK